MPVLQGWDKVIKKDESEWVYVQVEPIIATEVWEEANRILRENTRRRRRKAIKHRFSGLVYCSSCQRRMHVHCGPRGRTKFCCPCGRKVAVDDMETMFREVIQEYYLKPEHGRQLPDFVQSLQDEIDTQETLLRALRTEAGEIER